MSITHTDQYRNRMELTKASPRCPPSHPSRRATSAGVTGLIAAFQHRLVMGCFARFSDHRLKDVGFERDWDGSIIPVTPDPRLPWAGGK